MPFYAREAIMRLPQPERTHLLHTSLPIGRDPEKRAEFLVPMNDRYAGTYVIGVQGTGKSSFLEGLIAFDIACGNAIVVIDAHGDLTDHCVAALAPSALERTYVLDMTDAAYPFGVNVFGGGTSTGDAVDTARRIDRVARVFEAVWSDVLSQAYLPRYLRAAVIVLLASGATLVEMKDFLLDEEYRTRLLTNLTGYDDVKRFWQHEYTQLSHAEQMQRVGPLIGKLETLFLGRPLMRNIFGQRKTTVNFRKIIDERAVLFIKLPTKQLTSDAELLGTILVSLLHGIIFSYADVPEPQRPGVSLYVDEFQHFATADFSEMFTEGRKFGSRVTIAHQYRNQIPPFLRDSTMTARTKVCFQTTPEDARDMAPLFPVQRESIQPEDLETDVCGHLLKYGADSPLVKRFIDFYLRPMQFYRHGRKVRIEDPQWRTNFNPFKHGNWLENMNKPLIGGLEDVEVDDPTTHLNPLFFHVMQTKNPNLSIPAGAVLGFSNTGKKFYQQAVAAPKMGMLQAPLRLPQAMIVMGENRTWWIVEPRNSLEQLYHLLFHLRETMTYLATHPIGKVTKTTPAEVAQSIAHLPQRTAYVRSNEDVGKISTFDAPAALPADQVRQMTTQIRAQTRAAFCRPREEVEREFSWASMPETSGPTLEPTKDISSDTDLPASRWETIE